MLDDLQQLRIQMIRDNTDTFRALEANNFLAQANKESPLPGNDYAGDDFQRFAEHCLLRQGTPIKHNETKMSYFSRAMSTSDFQSVLGSLTSKMTLQRLERDSCHLS
jgi:hypothetical protein